MAKTTRTPDVADDVGERHAAPLQIPLPRTRQWQEKALPDAWMNPARDQREP
jgi:hypothetical protein